MSNHEIQLGMVGQKCGMSRIFKETGEAVPVTIISAAPNHVTQLKTLVQDGYSAIQVTTGTKRASLVNNPLRGHFKKANVEPGTGLWELRPNDNKLSLDKAAIDAAIQKQYPIGTTITLEHFTADQAIDVVGTTKGKGFAGVVKRHNFRTQDATHGNSLAHRAPGSIGQNQTPGRVFKGKKMAGHMGNERQSTLNLTIVKVDTERSLIYVKGAVPGAPGGMVVIKPSVKDKSTTKKGG